MASTSNWGGARRGAGRRRQQASSPIAAAPVRPTGLQAARRAVVRPVRKGSKAEHRQEAEALAAQIEDKMAVRVTANGTMPAEPRRRVGPLSAERFRQARNMSIDEMNAAAAAVREMTAGRRKTSKFNPFQLPDFPKGAVPPPQDGKEIKLAMDEGMNFGASAWANAAVLNSVASEGLMFLGYPFLSELAQRPEYRVMSDTIATEMTRKWIKLQGTSTFKRARKKGATELQARHEQREADDKNAKIKDLSDFLDHLKVRECYAEAILHDGLFGRGHIYHQIGDGADDRTDVGNGRDGATQAKVGKDSLKRLKVIEPVWCYPTTYNATNPKAEDWYNPQVWYVMSDFIHASRMPRFVSREVPDLLKPAYAFGGLSLTQLAKPYVDIWLTTRESVGQLIHSFSVMVLLTDLETILQPGAGGALMARVNLFNALRDNQGTFVLNEATEDFKNVSASLAGLHELQAQAQEHMFSVSRIPAVKFAGLSPQGLNASSEGEIRAFYDTIHAGQNHLVRPQLTKTIDFSMWSLWGKRDPEITFEFIPLWEMTEKEKAENRKSEAEAAQLDIDSGVISPAERRKVLVSDPDSPYQGLDPDDLPEPPQEDNPAGEGGDLNPEKGAEADGGSEPGQKPAGPKKPAPSK